MGFPFAEHEPERGDLVVGQPQQGEPRGGQAVDGGQESRSARRRSANQRPVWSRREQQFGGQVPGGARQPLVAGQAGGVDRRPASTTSPAQERAGLGAQCRATRSRSSAGTSPVRAWAVATAASSSSRGCRGRTGARCPPRPGERSSASPSAPGGQPGEGGHVPAGRAVWSPERRAVRGGAARPVRRRAAPRRGRGLSQFLYGQQQARPAPARVRPRSARRVRPRPAGSGRPPAPPAGCRPGRRRSGSARRWPSRCRRRRRRARARRTSCGRRPTGWTAWRTRPRRPAPPGRRSSGRGAGVGVTARPGRRPVLRCR